MNKKTKNTTHATFFANKKLHVRRTAGVHVIPAFFHACMRRMALNPSVPCL